MAEKPIARRLRFEILRRDGHRCRYCGAQAPEATLVVDHVIPRALGGSDDPTNLVTACTACNIGKASTSPDERIVADVDAKALQWAQAMEQAAEIQRHRRTVRDEELEQFYDHWTAIYRYVQNDYLPDDWAGSIIGFLDRGLTPKDLHELAYVARERGVPRHGAFRYFAGACWRTLKDRAELALRLLEDE